MREAVIRVELQQKNNSSILLLESRKFGEEEMKADATVHHAEREPRVGGVPQHWGDVQWAYLNRDRRLRLIQSEKQGSERNKKTVR